MRTRITQFGLCQQAQSLAHEIASDIMCCAPGLFRYALCLPSIATSHFQLRTFDKPVLPCRAVNRVPRLLVGCRPKLVLPLVAFRS